MKRKLSSLIILVSCLVAAGAAHSRQAQPSQLTQPTRRGLSLIAVPTESQAAELRARIQSGAPFEAIAMIYSTDASASRSGYIGMVNESSLSRELQNALRELNPGSVSAVTRVAGGFVLLKKATADEDRWRSLHDNAVSASQQSRYSEAASLFLAAVQQAEKLGVDDVRLAESLNGLAQVYRYQLNHVEAEPVARRSLTILERALTPSHSGVIPSLVHLAGIAEATGRYGEAGQLYRRILSVRWGAADGGIGAEQVLENFAEVLSLDLTRDSGLKNALDEFWRSLADSRLNKDLYVSMRDGFIAAQLMMEAESLMQRAVAVYPDSRQLQYQLGELYAIWGKYQKAIDVLKSAARTGVSTNSELDRYQLGLIYERIGEMNFNLVQFDDAIAALSKALEVNPASWSSRLLLGAAYLRRNKFGEAAAEYSRAISTNSRIAAAHEGLAQVNLDLGRYAEAATGADRALAIDPRLQKARYIKGMALIRGGKEREGRTVLQDYEQREGELRTAASGLSAIADLEENSLTLLSEGRGQEAMAVMSDGIGAYPLHARLHLRLGLIQSRIRLHREAAETFETMIRLRMDDFLVHRQLAREYEQLGNEKGAQQHRALYLQKYDAALQKKSN
jgi:tetratricopeptide (TPR) repeat protein